MAINFIGDRAVLWFNRYWIRAGMPKQPNRRRVPAYEAWPREEIGGGVVAVSSPTGHYLVLIDLTPCQLGRPEEILAVLDRDQVEALYALHAWGESVA